MSEKPVDRPPAPIAKGQLRVNESHSAHSSRVRRAPDSTANQGTWTPALIWRAVQQWWKIALPAGILLAAGGGAVVWLMFEPSYRASAWLRIKERPDYLAFKSDQESSRFSQNQIELIRGPVVLERVLAVPSIAQLPAIKREESPLDWLKKSVVARAVGGSEIFEIFLAAPNPAHAAEIVNAIVDAYLDVQRSDSSEHSQRVIQLLNDERERRGREVEQLRTNVRTLAKQVTGKDPFAVGSVRDMGLVRSPQAVVQERLATVEVDREVQQARLKAMTEDMESQRAEVPDSVVDAYVESVPEVQKLKELVELKRARLGELEGVASSQYQSGVSRLKAEVAEDDRRLSQMRSELRGPVIEQFEAATNTKRKEALEEMQSQVANLAISEELLKQRLEKLTQGQVQTGDYTLELEFAKNELTRAERVYQQISERVLALSTELRAPERVWLLKRAAAPVQPEEVAPYKMLGLVCLACLMVPFGLAVIWERLIGRISDSHQLQTEAHLPVVGEVAELPVRRLLGGPGAANRLNRNRGIFEESIDSLRTTIVLAEELKDMKVLALVSAVSREGKTSLAAQLAVSLAKSINQPVLLVDADMRSPDLHELFEVPVEPGLAGVLDHQCTVAEAIVPTGHRMLHVLPAGRLHRSPHSVLGNGAVKSIVDQVRSQFRYIIFDTPPVLAASEALVFAKAADGALICTMREVSRAPQVKMTYERLEAAGVTTIGVVLNGVPTKHYAYKYGAYAYVRG